MENLDRYLSANDLINRLTILQNVARVVYHWLNRYRTSQSWIILSINRLLINTSLAQSTQSVSIVGNTQTKKLSVSSFAVTLQCILKCTPDKLNGNYIASGKLNS